MANEPHPNQEVAGDRAFDLFSTGSVQYVILKADVQSGKTGCYLYIARLMLSRGIVDDVYFLCGSNETSLRAQAQKDVRDYFDGTPFANHVHVLFRQDFNKSTMNQYRVLIVNDESHLDCKKGQLLHQFLGRHHLNMSGTTPYMIRQQVYILSVSATPFAEEAAMSYKASYPKELVQLQPGAGYFGPSDYLESGRLQSTFALSSQDQRSRFIDLVQTTSTQKYVLLRGGEKRNARSLSPLIADLQRKGMNIYHFTSAYEGANAQITITREEADAHEQKYGVRIPSLEDQPERTSIVLLDGRLRCGKRVPKEHVGMVWEMGNGKLADVIIQSLLGRMSGYDVPRENPPYIYVSPHLLKERSKKVITESDLRRYVIQKDLQGDDVIDEVTLAPLYATNLVPKEMIKKQERDGVVYHACVPIPFTLSSDQIHRMHHEDALTIKSWCLDRLIELVEDEDLFGEQPMTDEQVSEIIDKLEQITADACNLRRYEKKPVGHMSNHRFHDQQVEAYRKQEITKESIETYPFLTFCVTFPGFVPQSEEHRTPSGHVFAVFNTRSTPFINTIPLECRVSKENGLTHFTMSIEDEKEEAIHQVVAASIHGLTSAVYDRPDEFEAQLRYFVRMERESRGYVSRQLSGVNGGIHLLRSAYGPNWQILKSIMSRIESTYHVKLSYPRTLLRNQPNIDYIISFIRWEPIQ
jgi:hypothetical protein